MIFCCSRELVCWSALAVHLEYCRSMAIGQLCSGIHQPCSSSLGADISHVLVYHIVGTRLVYILGSARSSSVSCTCACAVRVWCSELTILLPLAVSSCAGGWIANRHSTVQSPARQHNRVNSPCDHYQITSSISMFNCPNPQIPHG